MFEPIKAILESLILHKFPISEMAELRGGSSFLRTALVQERPQVGLTHSCLPGFLR
jgi:hypothetical protein